MTFQKSFTHFGFSLLAVCIFGCSSDSTPAGGAGTPGVGGSPGGSGAPGSAGNPAVAGSPAAGSPGAAGSPSLGAGAGGDSSGAAGASAGAATGGSSGRAGSAGGAGGAGNSGSAGSAGSAGSKPIDGGTGAASFHCVNWAVNGDNFQDKALLLSGIFDSDTTYEQVKARAQLVEDAYTDVLKANSFRMPINEPTVNDAAKWNAYKAIIDVGVAKGMKVVISFWAKDTGIGKPANIDAWYTMWKTVIDAYLASPTVYFDIHNEPHGYNTDQWVQQVKDWIAKFPTVPRNRIIVAGSGWDTNVYKVDQAFPDLLLEVHDYSFNNPSGGNTWTKQLLDRSSQGNYSRTIVGEWGTGVRGANFSSQGNNDFMIAFANAIKDNKMGSCWWPGLWAIPGNTSSWSLLNLNGGTNNAPITYSIQNQSGMDRIWHSWGLN